MAAFTKRGTPAAIAAEAAGLNDLARAARAGGAPVVRLLSHSSPRGSRLDTALLSPASPSASAAEEFARRLAVTHAHCPEGSRVFGQAPAGLVHGGRTGDGVMGAAPLPLVAPDSRPRSFGEFYAEDRLLAYLSAARANGSIDEDGARVLHRLADRLREGAFDAPQPALVHTDAALLHGDLWSGNLYWATRESAARGAVGAAEREAEGRRTGEGGCVAVLIDPASQGGHAESDLAQLTVFGAPFTDRIYAAYDEASPLADGWRERVGLHRLHILIVHAALFGGAYGRQTVRRHQPTRRQSQPASRSVRARAARVGLRRTEACKPAYEARSGYISTSSAFSSAATSRRILATASRVCRTCAISVSANSRFLASNATPSS